LPLFIEGLTVFGLTVSMNCTTSLLLLKPFEMNTHLGEFSIYERNHKIIYKREDSSNLLNLKYNKIKG